MPNSVLLPNRPPKRPRRTLNGRSGAPILASIVALALAIPAFSQQSPDSIQKASDSSSSEQGATTGKADETPKKKKKKKSKKLSRKEIRALEEALPQRFQIWLDEVYFLISDEEKRSFFEIEQDYQRDAFIKRFWDIRDPYQGGRNEFKEHWYERLEIAKIEFEDMREDRTRIFLTNGPPTGRIEFKCTTTVYPLEIWFYDGSDRYGYEFFVLFYQRNGGKKFYLWHPSDGVRELRDFGASASSNQDFFQDIYTCREGDTVAAILYRLLHPNNTMNYEMLLARIEVPSETPDGEWIETFSSYSTEVPEEAKKFEAAVKLEYPERYQSRTVVQGTIEVPRANIEASNLTDNQVYNFFLTGEILLGEDLFEPFRYKFDLPAAEIKGDTVPLQFERRLRPGTYTLILKLEDLNGQSFFRYKEDILVPLIEPGARKLPDDPETRKIVEAAGLAISNDVPTIQLVEPYGTMQVGMVRFDTLVTGQGIDEVRFALDDRVILQKRRPPYSVELDLGSVPRARTVRVSAHDAEGNELTSDELSLNAGQHQFQVRLLSPRSGEDFGNSVDVEASVLTPEGRPVQRVEIYYNETLNATLFQEPWVHRVDIAEPGQLAYIRAVAYLPDGNTTDHMVYINAPDYLENVNIEFVELYASVLDKQNRPLLGLEQSSFSVLEDDVAQQIARFEVVENLPIHAQVMIDVSASMKDNVEGIQRAALEFFQTLITPKDRASLMTFNDHPFLAVKFTNDIDTLAGGLAGLKAERGTALYDALVSGLYYMNGLKGQKAMLLLSDGKDEVSKFTWDQTLEYARRAGVSIYAIGLNIKGKESGQAKNRLQDLSNETGGRAFFIKDISELPDIYQSIQIELRSRYLIAYQSTNSDPKSGFREVRLKSSAPGSTVKTLRGYYP